MILDSLNKRIVGPKETHSSVVNCKEIHW